MTDFQLSLNLLLLKCAFFKPPCFSRLLRSNYCLILVTSYTPPSSSFCAFPSPVILPRVMLSWAVARKEKVLEVLSPKRCTPGLQRIMICPCTFEHCLGFQSTTWWGMSNPDWTVGSPWWKKMSHYLPQNKTKDFSCIYKAEEDKKRWKIRIIIENYSLCLAMTC